MFNAVNGQYVRTLISSVADCLRALAFDTEYEELLVADKGFVHVFGVDGTLLRYVRNGILHPFSVAVDGKGHIFLLERSQRSLKMLKRSDGSCVHNIRIDRHGAWWDKHCDSNGTCIPADVLASADAPPISWLVAVAVCSWRSEIYVYDSHDNIEVAAVVGLRVSVVGVFLCPRTFYRLSVCLCAQRVCGWNGIGWVELYSQRAWT
jgi:hypothetical protein